MKSKQILIADRDPKFCRALEEQFSLYEDYSCQCFDDATGALAAVEGGEADPDVLLIDSCLPDMPLREFHAALRAKGVDAPVVFMMRPGDDEDEESFANLIGINDFVMRPFRFADLLACVQANLRAGESGEESDIPIGPYRFRHAAKVVMEKDGDGAGRKIRLTEKEADILKFLFEAGGQVVPREVLLAEVWGYNSGVTTHTLETHIYRLRQKIERDPSNAEYLVTEAGGYRLVTGGH